MADILPPNPGESVTVPGDPTLAPATGGQPPAAPPAAPPAPPAPAEDPLSVEIKSAIAKARQDEKDKQYKTIERERADKKAAEVALSQANETIASLTKQLESAVKPEKPPTKPDSSPEALESRLTAVAESVASSVLERAEKEIFGPKISALEAQLTEARQQVERSELATYRNQLVEANKGAIIPELVQGSTKQELDEALLTAKQVFARTVQSIDARRKGAVTAAGDSLVPMPPATPGGGTSQDPTPGPKVKGLSDADYAKSREALLKEASEMARAAAAALD